MLHAQDTPGTIPSRVYTVEPTGDITYVHVFLGESFIIVSVTPDVRLRADQPVWIEFDQERLHLFDATTEQALRAD
jgi:multiple sugar transport system ATP-binding protein